MIEQAYMTVLTNSKYIPGIKALERGLREVQSNNPLYILLPCEKKSLLDELKLRGVTSDVILLPAVNIEVEGINKNHYWNETFFKLQVFSCTQFKKIILLDSDMLILKNIDHLFTKDNFSAVVAGRTVHPDWDTFNSGMMVIEPDFDLHSRLIKNIMKTIEKRERKGMAAGDQDVLHDAYENWREKTDLHLPEKYNAFWWHLDRIAKQNKWTLHDFHIVHFIGKRKPWEYTRLQSLRQILSCRNYMQINTWCKYRKYCK